MPNSLRTKLSKLRYEGHITDAEHKELIDKLNGHDKVLLDDHDQELIRKFRDLQQTALKKGYTQGGGYCRGVTDCLRVMVDEYEVPESPGDFETRGCCT
jgi:hypothetical protein